MKNNPKIALVYERVNTPYGGAEEVVLALAEIFPQAPLFTLVYSPNQAPWSQLLDVRVAPLTKPTFIANHHRLCAPLMPLSAEQLDLSSYDIVISVSSAEAKGVLTNPDQLHICYLLTPTRYLYSHRTLHEQQLTPLLRPFAHFMLNYMTWWDQIAASRPDKIIPISKLVQERTQRYYHRSTSQPIYPPVTTLAKDSRQPKSLDATLRTHNSFVLMLSRLVPYKDFETVIKATSQLKQPLIIAGTGPLEKKLQTLSKTHPYFTFIGQVTNEERTWLLSHAQALVMPAREDFGITALEAVAMGTPVILHEKTGASEILNEKHAIKIPKSTVTGVIKALKELQSKRFDPVIMKKHITKYDKKQFQKLFLQQVMEEWSNHVKQ